MNGSVSIFPKALPLIITHKISWECFYLFNYLSIYFKKNTNFQMHAKLLKFFFNRCGLDFIQSKNAIKFNKLHTNLFFLAPNKFNFNQIAFSHKKVNVRLPENFSPLNKILSLVFIFNYFTLNEFSKLNHKYLLLFGRKVGSIAWVNNNKFLSAWRNAFEFLYNIFYFNTRALIFSSSLFKKQTLAFNWKHFNHEIDFWRASYPFFISKTNSFKKEIDFFYKKLKRNQSFFIIITDAFYHYKNLYYFKKHNFPTLGLLSASINPWLFSYSLPALFNNFFTQIFFLKILLILKNSAEFTKIQFYRQLWFQNYLI